MKKLIPTILILTLALLASPSQSYAAWWNPSSWFSKDQQATTSTNAISIVSPANDVQNPDVKTIEELRAEVATLKASLDSLYTAHNNLVEDHNALLKYVNTTASLGKSVGTATNNSLDTKVTSLEKKLDAVCSQIFSSLGGFGSKCPSSSFVVGATLESRIKKLESGF